MAERRRIALTTDQELKKVFKVYVDDEGILNLDTLGVVKDPEANTRQAELIAEAIMKILEEEPQTKYDMIVNLLPLGKKGYASSKARKIYLQISSHKQIRRFAIVGGSIFVRTMAGFFIRAAGKDENMRWFATRGEATEWLKEVEQHGEIGIG